MKKNKVLLQQVEVLVLTTCKPQSDPRSLHWAKSFVNYWNTNVAIIYPAGKIQVQKIKNVQPNVLHIQELSIEVDSLSTEDVLSLLKSANLSFAAKLLTKLRDSVLPESTGIHRTLVRQCIDQMYVAFVAQLIVPRAKTGIVTDIQGLCAGSLYDSKNFEVVYDAQEITVHGFPGLAEDEIEFWIDIEKLLVSRTAVAVTVSPGIATWQEESFGKKFEIVPNFEPLSNGIDKASTPQLPVKFVYYGGCAPEKNITSIVQNWDVPKNLATLTIVARKTPDRYRLEKNWNNLKRKNSKVCFLSHNDATTVCDFLTNFDVGVLPYSYPYPYSEASPNKFGQYLAAGLAVVANRQGFVAQLITSYNVGLVTDLQDSKLVVEKVFALGNLEFLETLKQNSHSAFRNDLNWDRHVEALVSSVMTSQSKNFIVESVIQDIEILVTKNRTIRILVTGLRSLLVWFQATRMGSGLEHSLSKNGLYQSLKRGSLKRLQRNYR